MNENNQNPEDMGRGGDTVLAHLSLGELVIPRAFLDDPEVMDMMKSLFEAGGANINEFIVGDEANKINPETGYPEFGFFSKVFGSIKNVFKAAAPVVLPILGSFIPGVGPVVGAALGGAAGGAISGNGIGGVLKGAALGAAGGYLSSGGLTSILGKAAHTLPAGVSGPVTSGSGILGALGSGGKAISGLLGSAAKLGGGNPLLTLGNIGANIYSANAGTEAAEIAARQQADSANQAIRAQQQALAQVRGDLSPFRDAGTSTVGGLTQLVNDPNAQKEYIQSNPFYQSLAEDAKDKLFANAAAKGKVGSGGTAAALQNSLLLIGSDLLNQNITQRQNVANLGANAAAQTGTFTQGAANNTGNLLTQIGNANAAGTIGGYNAKTGAINNAIGTQTALYGIDKGVRI